MRIDASGHARKRDVDQGPMGASESSTFVCMIGGSGPSSSHHLSGTRMKKHVCVGLLVALPAAVAAPSVSAHFKMLSPAGWIVEDERGDPQKIAPYGGTNADPGTPTGAVTQVEGGGRLTIAIDETIFHPGHYRSALARTRAGLPPDPEVTMQETERGPRSLSAKIEAEPQPPVLLDGLWAHTERPA